MKILEFVKSSERTLASNLHIDSGIKINLLHSAIGVSTEVGEIIECLDGKLKCDVDAVNLAEEIADVMWYLAIPIRDYGLNITDIDPLKQSAFYMPQLLIDSANFLDMLKKVSFYGKPIDGFLVDDHVRKLLTHVFAMVDEYDIDLELALSNNQDKLKARFPEKYDNEKALNRDTNVERTELEKGM